MELGEAIYYLLSHTSGVTDLVNKRIYPLVAPQGTVFDYLTYLQVTEDPVHASGGDAGVENPSIQVSCFSLTYAGACALATAVKAAMRDYSGTIGSGDTLTVQWIYFTNRVEFRDVDPETKTVSYHIALDFDVWHE